MSGESPNCVASPSKFIVRNHSQVIYKSIVYQFCYFIINSLNIISNDIS